MGVGIGRNFSKVLKIVLVPCQRIKMPEAFLQVRAQKKPAILHHCTIAGLHSA
jgi:hypothetical protein